MEFLVRLEDKRSTGVICLNPVHRNRADSRVSFEDDTFKAPCPVCGSSDYLIRLNDKVTKKGHFITFKPDGWNWGRLELKHYGVVRIDCTFEQAQAWCSPAEDEHARSVLNQSSVDEAEKENLVMKARSFVFDFEKALPSEKVDNWKDKRTFSEIVEVKSDELSYIKQDGDSICL